jgi:hypothetical protein
MTETVNIVPLERLESWLGQIQEAKARHRLGDALDAALQATQRAEGSISRLEQLAGFTPLVAAYLDPSDREQCRRLLNDLKGVGRHLKQASDAATLQSAATKVPHLQGLIDQADALVRRGWKAKTDQAFSATARLGAVLREIPETQQLGSDMDALTQRAQQLEAYVEDAEWSTAEFAALEAERDRAKDKLAKSGAGEEVVTFLLAVAARSATLATVTRGVRDWLDAREALERFNVGL